MEQIEAGYDERDAAYARAPANRLHQFPHIGKENHEPKGGLFLEMGIRAEASEIIGESDALKSALDLVSIVAPTDSSVLIWGETGTGKELIARRIHNLSSRRGLGFVKLNCGGIPPGFLER